jgi:hypothetical protein
MLAEHMTRAWSLETTHTLGIRMTTVRPGFVASAGIGPDRIARAIDGYEADPHAAGFDSLGNVLAAEGRAEKDGDAGAATADAMRPYRGMMASNAKMLRMGVAGAAQPAFNVARTVKDALVGGAAVLLYRHRLMTLRRRSRGCSQCTRRASMRSLGKRYVIW